MGGRAGRGRKFLTGLAVAVIVLVAIALILVAAEMAVRYAYRHVQSTSTGFSYFDQKWQSSWWGNRNFLGFRERNFHPVKPRDTFRIAVIGDSFTWGQGVDTAFRFSDQLECLLNEQANGEGRDYQVLNFGFPGYGVRHERELIEGDIVGIDADFVLLQWFANDIDEEKSLFFEDSRGAFRTWVDNQLTARSALYFVLKSRLLALSNRLTGAESYFEFLVRRYGPQDGEPWRRAEAGLRALLESLKASPGSAVVLFPLLADPSPAVTGLDRIMDRVAAIVAGYGISVVDLRQVFRDGGGMRRFWVNEFDHHPGKNAHALAAWGILAAQDFESMREVPSTAPPDGPRPVLRTECRTEYARRHRP